MALPLAGTFDYVGTLPPFGTPPWTMDLQTAADRRDPSHPSLFGPRARLVVEEAGLTPNAGYHRGVWRPEVLRLRFKLTTGGAYVPVGGATFHVDRGLAKAFRPGDLLHLSRTSCGGLGLSVLRSDRLIVAVGAIRAVPLGRDVSARFPNDLVSEVEAAFHRSDPTFELPEYPVEIVIDGQRAVIPGSKAHFTDWEVTVFCGVQAGIPGTDESVVICRRGACSSLAAKASAQLMADGISLET